MDVGDDGYAEGLPYLAQDAEGLLVAYALERVETGTIGLAIGTLEDKGYVEPATDSQQSLCNVEGHFFALDDARAGQEKEVAGL